MAMRANGVICGPLAQSTGASAESWQMLFWAKHNRKRFKNSDSHKKSRSQTEFVAQKSHDGPLVFFLGSGNSGDASRGAGTPHWHFPRAPDARPVHSQGPGYPSAALSPTPSVAWVAR